MKPLEQHSWIARRVFVTQPVERRLHDGLGPPAFKDLVRRQIIHWFEKITISTGPLDHLLDKSDSLLDAAVARLTAK